MNYNKYTDNYYKASSLYAKDDIEQILDLTNEYGYNFCSNKKTGFNDDSLWEKPKNVVNKDYINGKR